MKPFLTSAILFSSMSSEEEKRFREELYLCNKNMGMSLTEIYRMPVMDRVSYIRIHNKITKELNEQMKG